MQSELVPKTDDHESHLHVFVLKQSCSEARRAAGGTFLGLTGETSVLETPLQTLPETLCSSLDPQERHRAWKQNPRVAETLFCFGEAPRKGSREAQMARQMMKTKQNVGKKLGRNRRKEKKGQKNPIK